MTLALGSQSRTAPEPVIRVLPSTPHRALVGIWGIFSLPAHRLLGHAATPTQCLVLCLAAQQLVVIECTFPFLISAFLKVCVLPIRTVVGLPRKCVSYICVFFPLFSSYMAMNFVLFWRQHL